MTSQPPHPRQPCQPPRRPDLFSKPAHCLALTLLLSLLTLLSQPAQAKRVALVVGNAAYQGETVLRNPVNDARVTDERSVRSEGLGLNDLLGDGADKRISRLVVILDACRNNPYTTRTRSSARGLAPPRETNGTLIANATADGQVADDGTGRKGVYTEHLLRQLRTNGHSKSIRELLEDTQLPVSQAKPDQRPKVYGDSALFRDVGWGGRIQLASVSPVPTGIPMQADPEQEAWDIAKRRDTLASYAQRQPCDAWLWQSLPQPLL